MSKQCFMRLCLCFVVVFLLLCIPYFFPQTFSYFSVFRVFVLFFFRDIVFVINISLFIPIESIFNFQKKKFLVIFTKIVFVVDKTKNPNIDGLDHRTKENYYDVHGFFLLLLASHNIDLLVGKNDQFFFLISKSSLLASSFQTLILSS